jgi:hypothetical protein
MDRQVGMDKAKPGSDRSVVTAVAPLWPGPGQCPQCHAPEGKRHGQVCIAGKKIAYVDASPADPNPKGNWFRLSEEYQITDDATNRAVLSAILTHYYQMADSTAEAIVVDTRTVLNDAHYAAAGAMLPAYQEYLEGIGDWGDPWPVEANQEVPA